MAIAVSVAVAAFGCGASDDHKWSGMSGIYRVTNQTSHGPCDGPGEPRAIRPLYFLVQESRRFDVLSMNVYSCAAAEWSLCEMAGVPLVDRALPTGTGFVAEEFWRIPDDTSCVATYTANHVIRTDHGVQIRSEVRTETLPLAQCRGKAEPSSGRALACSVLEVRDGQRVPD